MKTNRLNKILPLFIWLVFEIVAVSLWLTKDKIFYLLNFTYIGTSIGLGLLLFNLNNKYSRRIVQVLIGGYMGGYLGLFWRENMQIEGFWFYLFSGVFEAATIHFAVAKIIGPLIFGRGWCGYGCWTAMVLDFLPYKIPKEPRKQIGYFRYVSFFLSLIFVGLIFLLALPDKEKILFWAFIIGNIIYYILGVFLAYAYEDNRAFCKYICPVTIFLKPASYFSLIRIKCDEDKCISCGKCRKVCPMEVDMLDSSRTRKNGTECILCLDCVKACPNKAL